MSFSRVVHYEISARIEQDSTGRKKEYKEYRLLLLTNYQVRVFTFKKVKFSLNCTARHSIVIKKESTSYILISQ